MIGQGGNGFSLEFSDKEVTVDAEITAIEYIKNFLAEFEEELDDEVVEVIKKVKEFIEKIEKEVIVEDVQ